MEQWRQVSAATLAADSPGLSGVWRAVYAGESGIFFPRACKEKKQEFSKIRHSFSTMDQNCNIADYMLTFKKKLR